jgi:hypothetical protein
MTGIILLKAHVRSKSTEYGDREILLIVINVLLFIVIVQKSRLVNIKQQ